MSIMFAGKSAAQKLLYGDQKKKPKSARPKKRQPGKKPGSGNMPPMSSSKTKVWNYKSDVTEEPYYVLLSIDSLEVWCNGEVLEVEEGFDEECNGPVLEFDLGGIHYAMIKGNKEHGEKEFVFKLFVDGLLVLEHTVDPTDDDNEPNTSMYQTGEFGELIPPGRAPPTYSEDSFDFDEPPPPYEEFESKKSK